MMIVSLTIAKRNNMSKKHIPMRMCIVCRKMFNKDELIKIVKNASGEIDLDLTAKAEGRGAYICKNEECISKCEKKKALNRAFSSNIDSSIYEKLKRLNATD